MEMVQLKRGTRIERAGYVWSEMIDVC